MTSPAIARVDMPRRPAKSCIVLFLLGGPPQHETWDPKPHTPAEIRGEFSPISSATPGLQVGELMPLTARLTEHIAVLRAMSTMDNAHSSSGYWMLTGRPHAPMNSENAPPGAPNDWPSLAAVMRKLCPDNGLPSSIRLPDEIWNDGRLVWPGQDAGWLGRGADPWLVKCDPAGQNFEVADLAPPAGMPRLRLDRRQQLGAQLDGQLPWLQTQSSTSRWNVATRQAVDLVSAAHAKSAFDLNGESSTTRDRYGRSTFGQSVLLARRLVESGVSFVQVNYTRRPDDPAGSPVWDTHAKNAERLKTPLMPTMDQAYSALLEDLLQRGLLDETLVVWMGEFGRSPRINPQAGRDHWGSVFSVALAGGGVRGGVVHGASDATGAFPASGRVQPQDLTATILHRLGHSPDTPLTNALGRVQAASDGRVIEEIL
ncbi:MAG: DUF1501 domain-containing protein [Planctomyces sp.]|nr:DUF1501 domain-containing protein [Planctomyces sp.]